MRLRPDASYHLSSSVAATSTSPEVGRRLQVASKAWVVAAVWAIIVYVAYWRAQIGWGG